MYQIIYVSQATRSLPPRELVTLLMNSQKANEAAGITGALVYNDQQFLQLLEGERQAVERLYARIVQDERHWNVRMHWEREFSARTFFASPMAFRKVSPAQFADLAAFLLPTQDELTTGAPPPLESVMLARLRQVVLEGG